MKLGGFAKRLASPLREFGWAAGALYMTDRLLRALVPRCGLYVYEMVAQPVPEGPLLPLQKTKDVWFKEVGPSDPEVAQMPPPAAVKAARFAQGATSLAVYRKDAFIGYIWFCFEQYREDEVRCTYCLRDPTQAVFDFDLYVFPQYRLGTAFACVWHAANDFLRARGVRHTFSRISRFNLASRRAQGECDRHGNACTGVGPGC